MDREVLSIKRRYGKRMVEARGSLPTGGETSVHVQSIADLITVADELGKPIIHQAPSTSKDAHVYYVMDAATRYQHLLTTDI